MSTPETGVGTGTAQAPLKLELDVDEVKNELALPEPTVSEVDPELDRLADEYAERLINLSADDLRDQDDAKDAVEDMGRSLQREAALRSQMLQQPIKDLSSHGGEGGPVANAMIDLKMKIEELDPNRLDFSPGWFSRMLGMLPGVGTPIKRYFTRFESTQTVIDAIIRSLEHGRDQLKRDNVTLREDQRAMRELTLKLTRHAQLAQLLDQKLEYRLSREIPASDPRHKFIQEELLFPLRQRIMDLQQQLAVNQQGVLATAIVMRNNLELVRGVDRSLDVTVSALQVAVTVALGLANQKIVLDKVTALNKTTSDLISGTAERLRTQGTAIHAQASSAMIDIDALKSAFADINAAMDEIARFRQEALPQMAQAILEFDELTRTGEKAIEKLEESERAAPELRLEAPED
jgi:uncharacterized protein YaaN involved in tellurite resistance